MAKVSVVIPSRNRKSEVQRAVRSVLAQTLKPHEIIVVDDGSTDDTHKALREQFPSITIIRNEESKGGAMARNIGADAASGEYLAFLDSDDEFLPDHLSYRVQEMENLGADGSFGTFYLTDGQVKNEIKFQSHYKAEGGVGDLILSFTRFDARTSTFVFRRESFLKVRFDDTLKKHQDWDLAIRFDSGFKFVLFDRPTVTIYTDGGRMSSTMNHEVSFRFLDKHRSVLSADSMFAFCLKNVLKSQLRNEGGAVRQRYKQFVSEIKKELSFRNRIAYHLLFNGGLRTLYTVKKMFSKN